jgi:LacI family transcriptional regulator
MKKPKLKDIARLAGVSPPVVSVALSGNSKGTTKLNEETRRRILKIAAEMHYKPDIFGRSLRANKSFLVGIMLFNVNSSLMGEFVRGAQNVLAKSGYSPIFFCHATKEDQRHNLKLCMERKVDGLIFNPWINEESGETDSEFIKDLLPDSFPLLEVYGRNYPEAISVDIDGKTSFYNMCCHLINSGYKKIYMVNYENYILGQNTGIFRNAWECHEGYRQAMEENNLPTRLILHPRAMNEDHTNCADYVYKVVNELFEHENLPDAIVCKNDEQAIGVLRACRQRNIRIPEDLAVCGFGDTILSQLSSPPLTSCRTSPYKIGATSADMILQLIKGQEVVSRKIIAELVLRKSC